MYRITLVNLEGDASRAAPELGRRQAGELSRAAVLELLARFRNLDPLQNFEADPEIIMETQRRKRLVRLNGGSLCLYDPGSSLTPALVLSPEEILRELDASAAPAGRTLLVRAGNQPAAARKALLAPPPVIILRPPQRLGLALVAVCLSGYLALACFPTGAAAGERFVPLADARQLARQQTALAGVYMTGNRPGDHGIVLGADGSMKLFQLNGPDAPSIIRDTYVLGHIDGQAVARCHQPAGILGLAANNTVTYCGETYRRVS